MIRPFTPTSHPTSIITRTAFLYMSNDSAVGNSMRQLGFTARQITSANFTATSPLMSSDREDASSLDSTAESRHSKGGKDDVGSVMSLSLKRPGLTAATVAGEPQCSAPARPFCRAASVQDRACTVLFDS